MKKRTLFRTCRDSRPSNDKMIDHGLSCKSQMIYTTQNQHRPLYMLINRISRSWSSSLQHLPYKIKPCIYRKPLCWHAEYRFSEFLFSNGSIYGCFSLLNLRRSLVCKYHHEGTRSSTSFLGLDQLH